MSIAIIWQTKMRNERDQGQKCIVCLNSIPPRSIAIRDMQSTALRRYYHPDCFMENCPRKTEEIYRFWSSLHVKNQERLFARR